jgi:ABC-type branched-subunit amino acid transport system substrate-binding protein
VWHGSGPDALLYAGVPFWGPPGKEPPTFPFVRELRARLGRDLLVIGPDSWAPGRDVIDALGRDARGIHFTYPGVPLERLGAAGRRFVAEFGATQPGRAVTVDALYTAQATEVLLDAIARSDGTRPSVARELLATRIEDGLIGDVNFDPDGDVRPRPYTVVRMSPRADAGNGVERGGGNIAAVISP